MRHGVRGGSAERKRRLLPLLLPAQSVGMRSAGCWARVPKASCRLKEEERGNKIEAGQKLEGNVPPAHIAALCGLLSDATHSVHYNKAVVCSAGSVQQGDKVLPLYQKQLQKGEKVLEQEISSFAFSLSLFSSFKPDSNSTRPLLQRAGIFTTACGTSRNLYPCLRTLCRVYVCVCLVELLSKGTPAPGLCLQGSQ